MFFRLLKNSIKNAVLGGSRGGGPPPPPPPLPPPIAPPYVFLRKIMIFTMIACHRPPRRVVADATSCSKRTALRDVVEWGGGGVDALASPPPLRGVGAASPLRGRSYM